MQPTAQRRQPEPQEKRLHPRTNPRQVPRRTAFLRSAFHVGDACMLVKKPQSLNTSFFTECGRLSHRGTEPEVVSDRLPSSQRRYYSGGGGWGSNPPRTLLSPTLVLKTRDANQAACHLRKTVDSVPLCFVSILSSVFQIFNSNDCCALDLGFGLMVKDVRTF